MAQNSGWELLTGAAVIAVAAGFLSYSLILTDSAAIDTYEVKAELAKADDIKPRSDVRIAGLKIGTVSTVSIDAKTYRVRVSMNIHSGVKIPADSNISVSGAMFSSNFLMISPGQSTRALPPGGTIVARQ